MVLTDSQAAETAVAPFFVIMNAALIKCNVLLKLVSCKLQASPVAGV